jgi:hypothetical protein
LLKGLEDGYIAYNDTPIVWRQSIFEDSRCLRRVLLCGSRSLRATSLIAIELLIVVTKFNLGELVNVFTELDYTLSSIVPAIPSSDVVEH